MNTRVKNGKRQKLIFVKFITRNGKRIYPKKAKAFKFWVDIA